MKLNKKKGFTIIELVIVIAVIGVLTAVLVPVFINLTSKANDAADQSLVKNLNTMIETAKADPEENFDPHTPTHVFDYLKTKGYLGEVLIRDHKGKGEILWNEPTSRFLFADKTSDFPNSKPTDFWAFKNNAATDTRGYSVYLYEEYALTAALAITAGLDVGQNDEVTEINYTGGETGKDVYIRTNGADETLNVNAPKDTVHHYDLVKSVDVITGQNSYHEHGTAGYVELKSGKVVAEKNGSVNTIVLTALNATDENPAVIFNNGGEFTNKYALTNAIAGSNNDVTGSVQLTLREGADQGDILLTSDEETAYASKTAEQKAAYAEDKTAEKKAAGESSLLPTPEGTGISTFEELQAAFANGGEYYLLDNIDVTAGIVTTKVVTIDFNGYHLNVNSAAYGEYGCVLVASESTSLLTFKDFANGSGGILNVSDNINDAVIGNFQGGNIVLDSGTYVSTENALFGGVSMGGTVTINGGALNGYFDAVIGLTFYVNTTCNIRYYEAMGSVPFNGGFMATINPAFANTIVTGPGVTQTGGNVNSTDTTFTFVKA